MRGLRPDPAYEHLCNYINDAVDQLDAVNPAIEQPDALAIVNGDDGAGFTHLTHVLTGNAYCESGEVIPMFRQYSEGCVPRLPAAVMPVWEKNCNNVVHALRGLPN